jgi:four helix bundle protein
MQDYRALRVWQLAHEGALAIYSLTTDFPKHEQFGLTSQLRRASVSIAANLAEGCGRNSRAELAHFAQTSLGSATEVEYLLLLSRDLQYINADQFAEITASISTLKRMLITFIRKLRATNE